MVDKDLVQKVARLAKLDIAEENLQTFQNQFSSILQDFESLQAVDTEGIAPMISPIEGAAILRKDRALSEHDVEALMENAPDRKGSLFKVPPVVS